MTIQTTRVYLCDAPGCAASSPGKELPADWFRVDSAAHLATEAPPVKLARRRSNSLSRLERSAGAIFLHLCPEHPTAFDGHYPRTSSVPASRGSDTLVYVSCSCGVSLGGVQNYLAISSSEEGAPSHSAERAWWRHLPEDLRGYTSREAS